LELKDARAGTIRGKAIADAASETNARVMRADFMDSLMVQSACRAKAEKTIEISSWMLALQACARSRSSFHCCIPQSVARSLIPSYAYNVSDEPLAPNRTKDYFHER
jgi:hypothetical protein